MPTITDSLLADLNRLRERGVRIAIDDLGTGHSSLARITQLPVDILKIDLRFTAGLGRDPACDAVVRAILSIGQAMGLSVVAEGVETPQQAELLRAYGCDTVQGYLYSRPQPEPELLHYLTNHNSAPPPATPSPDHTLQFYEHDEDLIRAAADYLTAAIRANEVAVVVATATHRHAFESAIAATGIDIDAARTSGALITVDAVETLESIMIDDEPNADRFDAAIGGLIRNSSSKGRKVRVYGEMVALLWQAGNVNAAIILERLWNALGRQQQFSLKCAYPLQAVDGDTHAVSGVFHQNSAVLGARIGPGAPPPGPSDNRRDPPSSEGDEI